MEVPDEENLEGETHYDPMEGWLKLVNVLHDATPIIAKKMIHEDEFKNSKTPIDNNLTYSEKFHAYVTQKQDQLIHIDKEYLKVSPENFLKGMDFYRLNRLLEKFFPTIHKDNCEKIKLLTMSRNQIVHEGKLLVATEKEFDGCFYKLKSSLIELGVEDNEIKNSMEIVVEDRNEYDALVKKAQYYQDEHQKLINRFPTMLSEDKQNWKIPVEPIKTNSPHKKTCDVLAEVFKCGREHPKYGKQLKRLDESFFYVDDKAFSIGEAVYLGYHDDKWIVLKQYLAAGKAKPPEVKMMSKLGSHCPDGHENIIKTIKEFFNDTVFYLTMPLCDYTLDAYCEQKSPTAIQRTELGKQLLKAMMFLHEDKAFLRSNENPDNSGNGNGDSQGRHGIVHRDLKPNNVLISMVVDGDNLGATKPLLKLADFGMSVERAKKNKTIKAKGLSAWEWRAPGSDDIENSPVWYENDVFVTNALLAYILSSNHLHPFKLKNETSKDLTRRYDKKEKINPKLDIHEDLRDLLNGNFQNYFEFYSFKEKQRIASNKQQSDEDDGEGNRTVVTDADKKYEEDIKEKLQIEKINHQFNQLYSVKHPEATPGKRSSIIVTCNREKWRDEANQKLANTSAKRQRIDPEIKVNAQIL